jgi:plasmid replication initiation protein
MSRASHFPNESRQLDLFVSVSGDIAARDAQYLMAWPFFSLAKSKRIRPIDFRMGEVSILVEATAEHGMATIWDADVLIWVASQIVEARDAGRPTSRLIAATPHEILACNRRRLRHRSASLKADDGTAFPGSTNGRSGLMVRAAPPASR